LIVFTSLHFLCIYVCDHASGCIIKVWTYCGILDDHFSYFINKKALYQTPTPSLLTISWCPIYVWMASTFSYSWSPVINGNSFFVCFTRTNSRRVQVHTHSIHSGYQLSPVLLIRLMFTCWSHLVSTHFTLLMATCQQRCSSFTWYTLTDSTSCPGTSVVLLLATGPNDTPSSSDVLLLNSLCIQVHTFHSSRLPFITGTPSSPVIILLISHRIQAQADSEQAYILPYASLFFTICFNYWVWLVMQVGIARSSTLCTVRNFVCSCDHRSIVLNPPYTWVATIHLYATRVYNGGMVLINVED
jgi:hypothetical protein